MPPHLTYAHLISSICLFSVLALVAAGPAVADVTVAGSGEPAYTNSANNTQWISYTVPAGADDYRLHARYYRNNAQVYEYTWSANTSGTVWMDWTGVATLEHGSTYAICVTGEYSFPNDSLYFSDGPNSCSVGTMLGKRTSTTIDRSKPSTSVALAGGAEFTNSGAIPLSIAFQDDVAGPYPANFLCMAAGTDPCTRYAASNPCSAPAGGGKSTTFGCEVDASELPDGPVTVCVRAADASVPNNASSVDQTRTASQANLSDPQCDTVVLDRKGPTLGIGAAKALFRTGEQAAFSSEASDAGSGLDASTMSWELGDGSAAVAGASASHSFDRPGTYVVKLRARDKAGNESVAQKTVTVEAPPGPTPTPGPTPGPTGPTGPLVAGRGEAKLTIGGVTVLVPKHVKLGRTKQIVLRARAEQGGTLTLRLTRGKKVYSRLSVGLARGDTTQRLRLPKRLRRGSYAVKIAFKANGTSYTAAGSAKVAVK
ncbi:MAG TPA: PKD domain-containing protein [Thermoleophilaceae bacterium]|nr:PKD domain-containing protein [Thermoleophilaceae bacterium]